MLEYPAVFALGAVGYGLLEIIWRGWTHWTMLLCGGVCFTLIYLADMTPLSMRCKCVMCAAAITTVEFVTGCIVNLKLGMNVWDYSALPYDLMGQICPRFALLWLGLSVPTLLLCRAIRRAFSAQHYTPKHLAHGQ